MPSHSLHSLMYRDESHSMDCSTMIRSVAIWSVHDLSLRKPAWWSLSLASDNRDTLKFLQDSLCTPNCFK